MRLLTGGLRHQLNLLAECDHHEEEREVVDAALSRVVQANAVDQTSDDQVERAGLRVSREVLADHVLVLGEDQMVEYAEYHLHAESPVGLRELDLDDEQSLLLVPAHAPGQGLVGRHCLGEANCRDPQRLLVVVPELEIDLDVEVGEREIESGGDRARLRDLVSLPLLRARSV